MSPNSSREGGLGEGDGGDMEAGLERKNTGGGGGLLGMEGNDFVVSTGENVVGRHRFGLSGEDNTRAFSCGGRGISFNAALISPLCCTQIEE